MAWVNARRVVAAMAHKHAVRYFSTEQQPRSPMGHLSAAINANRAIPESMVLSVPDPAPCHGFGNVLSLKSCKQVFAGQFSHWVGTAWLEIRRVN
jgi:hypothetical protein